MLVYLDESGDTGWTFTHPFRHGGSSRFLCLAFMFLPESDRKLPKKIISGLYAKYGWKSEMKASQAVESQKLEFCSLATQLLVDNKNIKIDCIVAQNRMSSRTLDAIVISYTIICVS